MKAKLIVEGREFPIEIQDPELQKLLMPQKTGYERVGAGQKYWLQDARGRVCWDTEPIHFTEYNEDYNSANYYSDDTIAKNNSRADKLMRQLRRFAAEHREKTINWDNKKQNKYSIFYDCNNHEVMVGTDIFFRYYGTIYFDSGEAAQLAIDTFRDELIWYFTEYKDSL